MSRRGFKLQIIDKELNEVVFEDDFDYINGKIIFLPSTNEMSKAVKHFSERESEFDASG